MNHGAARRPPAQWEWAVCGASVIGSEHQRRGLGCDDAFSYGVAGDFVVAAVADGAGSVTGTSAWGSYTACQSVLADATTRLFIDEHRAASVPERETMMRWLFDRALECVRQQAHLLGLDVGLLSTTLCVAVADLRAATFGEVGDGVIATESEGRITTLLMETKDDYANATWFIQSDGAFDTAYRCVTHPGSTAFALSTDGMSYKITNVATGEAYQPFFKGSWEHVRGGVSSENLGALLRGIEDDQTGDDKTMVLAALRRPEKQGQRGGREERRVFTDSSPRPPLTGTEGAVLQDHSARREDRETPAGWVTVTPTVAGADTPAPDPRTDEIPRTSRPLMRRGIIRRRPS